MKTVLYLSGLFVVLICVQIGLEYRSDLPAKPTGHEVDTLNTQFRIEEGKILFLRNHSEWVELDDFVWKGEDGKYYRHLNGSIFTSKDKGSWELVMTLRKPQALPVSN